MEIYKGTSAFSGIAIGKILYYHRGEYQIRQSMVDNVKKELDRLDNARTAVKNQIQHMYKNGAPLPKEQELTLKRQLKLLSGGRFQRAVESMKNAGMRNVRVKFYPGARHELLVETNKLEVFADIGDFVEQQL